MKEQLYTIPLNDAVNAGDECPFCFIERSVEQDLLDFVLGSGSSYMEADIREMTDKAGFCRQHFKKKVIGEMKNEFAHFKPAKTSLKDKLRKAADANPIAAWVRKKESTCYICDHFADTYARYMDTFFYLWNQDNAFRQKIKDGKGFCLHHFGDLCQAADAKLSGNAKDEFYSVMFPLMESNMGRLSEDVAWMVEKFDYRNKDADWKNSKDAIQRGMQKLKGGYPADGPYTMSK